MRWQQLPSSQASLVAAYWPLPAWPLLRMFRNWPPQISNLGSATRPLLQMNCKPSPLQCNRSSGETGNANTTEYIQEWPEDMNGCSAASNLQSRDNIQETHELKYPEDENLFTEKLFLYFHSRLRFLMESELSPEVPAIPRSVNREQWLTSSSSSDVISSTINRMISSSTASGQ